MERLELYSAKTGEKTGTIITRGTPDDDLPEGERIAVAIIYIENDKNEFLVQKTSEKKGGIYSFTAGHVRHEEEPIDTIIREVKEELGIDIKGEDISNLGFAVYDFPVRFIFYLKKDIRLDDITLQTEEVESVSYMSKEKIIEIIENGLMHEAHAKILKRVLEYKNSN